MLSDWPFPFVEEARLFAYQGAGGGRTELRRHHGAATDERKRTGGRMTRKLDVIILGDPQAVARPVMPSACETGGCGGQEPMLPPPPSFGEVRVNGVEITPEALAEEIQHHPAPDAETAWIEAASALAVRELLLQEASRLGLSADAERGEAGRLEADDDALEIGRTTV